MPYYYHLRRRIRGKTERDKVIDKLLHLRRRLDRQLPPKDSDLNLLLATWNIRDFDKRIAGASVTVFLRPTSTSRRSSPVSTS